MNKSLFYILRDFADWTGIPGLIQMINALNIYVLFAWLICFGVMWGVFIYEMIVILQKFFSFPAQVTLSIENKVPRTFPVITICNQNPMNYTMVQTNSSYSQINQLIEDYLEVVENDYGDIKVDQFGLNSQPTAYMKGEYARESLLLLINQLSIDKRQQAGYDFENFLVSWYWNKQPANSSHFTPYLDPTYGLCYQFNADNTTDEGLIKSERMGTSYGLKVVALVHQYSPSNSQEYMPLTQKVGLRVGINYYNSSPTMESIGVDVKPGTETLIKLKVTEIKRAKKPYGRCIDTMTGDSNYYSDFNYTMAYCLRSCVQAQYIATCKCAHPLYLKPFQSSYCTIDNIDCVFGIRESQAQTASNAFNPIVNCSCFPACKDTVYEPVLSIGRFPSSMFLPRSQPNWDSPYACTSDNRLFNGSIQNCIKWFQDNAVLLNIYVSGTDYQLMTEDSSYDLTAVTNDLGGQMGLWTGCSLVCVLEIIILFIILILYFIFGRKITDVDVTDMHREKDRRYDAMRNLKEELDTQEIMDDEIKFRYRELQMRPERKRLERLDEGYRLNEQAVRKAAMKARQRRPGEAALNPSVKNPAPSKP